MSQPSNNQPEPARVGGLFNAIDGKQFGELEFSAESGFSFRPSARKDLGQSSRTLQAMFITEWEEMRQGYLIGGGTFCDAGVCITPAVEEIQEVLKDGEVHRVAKLERESWEALANGVLGISSALVELRVPFSPDFEGIGTEYPEGDAQGGTI